MKQYDIAIIRAGPSGLASAAAAYHTGATHILIIAREDSPAGILNQCLHAGFSLHPFYHELTPPHTPARLIPPSQ